MFTTPTFESRLATVKNALGPSTRKPPVPSDRRPQMHQKSPKKSDQCFDLGFENKKHGTDKELQSHRLWKSMIMMLGSFIERSPESKQWTRPELREFITQVEICLELKPGELDIHQYANLLIKFDALVPFKDGELTTDLNSLDQIINAYGDKLAAKG